MDSYIELARRVLFLAPAFVANASPLVIKSYVKRRHPVDFGRVFVDGRRIFGDSKSWEGLAAGVLAGAAAGAALSPAYGRALAELAAAGLVQGLGAMVGDLVNSFVKRRLGMRPGAPLPVLDQVSFIAASLAFVRLLGVDRLAGVELGTTEALAAVGLALVLHPLTNYLAYVLGIKEVPY